MNLCFGCGRFVEFSRSFRVASILQVKASVLLSPCFGLGGDGFGYVFPRPKIQNIGAILRRAWMRKWLHSLVLCRFSLVRGNP